VAKTPDAPEEDPLAFQVLNEIGIVDQLSQNKATQILAPALNMAQFTVLNHFARLGGERSLVQLANAIQVTKGAMTNTVTRLLDKGMVDVRPDQHDGRSKLVSLNAAGRRARTRAVRQLGTALAELGGEVPAGELRDALVTLRKLRVWFDGNR
jgi:DNA-binding MarR family transcriptional regulator